MFLILKVFYFQERKMNKYVFVGIAALAFLIIFTYSIFFIDRNSISQEVSSDEQEQHTSLTIGYSRLRISLPIFVAQERDIFRKYGLNVKLSMYETAQPLMQSLIEGKVDAAGYTALPITYNAMIRNNKKLYFLTTMVEDQDHRVSYLLRPQSKEDTPPSIKTIEDLKGKRVGILPTIAYKSWLESILKRNGLKAGLDVQIQQLSPALQAKALRNGGVDALFTNDPAATSAIETGVAELVSNDVEVPKYIKSPFPFGSFNVSKEWADKNPITFKNIILALNEAIEFINSNPKKSKQYMKPYISGQFVEHVDKYPDAYYLNTIKSKEDTFQELVQMYMDMGIIKRQLDLSGLVIEGDFKQNE